jgi:hypothetical protein
VCVLATASSLPRVLHFAVSRAGESLLVGDLRTADAGHHTELATEPIEDCFELLLGRGAYDDFASARVGRGLDRPVVRHQHCESVAKPFLVGFAPRLDHDR